MGRRFLERVMTMFGVGAKAEVADARSNRRE
jgi:hypothetical protein